jgi:hypothetical protein
MVSYPHGTSAASTTDTLRHRDIGPAAFGEEYIRNLAAVGGCWSVALLLRTATDMAGRSQTSSRVSDAKRLIGTCRLVSFESNDEESRRARGAHPVGLLFYDATGHMSAQSCPIGPGDGFQDRRRRFSPVLDRLPMRPSTR